MALPMLLRATADAEGVGGLGAERDAGEKIPYRTLWTSGTVLWSMGCFCLSNASLSFYDAALAVHAKATLDFGALETGLVYLVPSLIYAICSPFAGHVVRTLGPGP